MVDALRKTDSARMLSPLRFSVYNPENSVLEMEMQCSKSREFRKQYKKR